MSSERIKAQKATLEFTLSSEDQELFKAAWHTARAHHGHTFCFYLPGMIRYGRQRGRYPAISITGNQCELLCEHCKGKLLEPMIKAKSPEALIRTSFHFARNGAHGILITGGADRTGMLPWELYYEAIRRVKEETSLYLSAHVGFPDSESCRFLKDAGLDQALIDAVGDERTAKGVYHLPGLRPVIKAFDAIKQSGLALVPHVVAGLHYGEIGTEYGTLEIISRFRPEALVIVVLTPLKGTPMSDVSTPAPLEVGRLIARARLLMPEIPISLGCERPRNRQGWLMERLAIWAGATRMAIWSEETVEECKILGLKACFQATCCSVGIRCEWAMSPSLIPR